jgi:hypothetical protein
MFFGGVMCAWPFVVCVGFVFVSVHSKSKLFFQSLWNGFHKLKSLLCKVLELLELPLESRRRGAGSGSHA